MPPSDRLEIAFAGRSNVGKSSLINALTGVRGLARTSNTPGRTQELNIFESETAPLRIIDMPGYGYAKAPKPMVDRWNALVRTYLQGRQALARVFVLIDARHGIKANDAEILTMLDKAAVSYQVVLTKRDKIGPKAAETVETETLKALSRRPAAFPLLVSTSSEKGDGIGQLRAAIVQLMSERGLSA